MKAVVFEKYGPPEVLHLQEVAKPVPKENEVLIKVFATTVTATDCMIRKGEPKWGRLILGLRKPRTKILGIEMAGEVEAVGAAVTCFRNGDHIFGAAMARMFCCAEYVCLPEKAGLATIPAIMTYDEAAAFCDGALTALTFLRDIGKVKRGQKVLINGASGSVGSFAVQLAKYYGAEVTGVCSTKNIAFVKSLGADQVVDYKKDDFTQGFQTYDLIFDTENKSSFSRCKSVLKQGGVYLVTMPATLDVFLQIKWSSIAGSKKVKLGASKASPENLNFLKELIVAEKIRSAIDRVYLPDQIQEAHRYVEKGHKKGNVVIRFE